MIPGALVAPPVRHRYRVPRLGVGLRVLGVVLLLAAVSGALSWSLLLSPFSMRRWSAGDPLQTVRFDEPGTYVIYEEGRGASARTGPAQVSIGVRSIGGRKIASEPLLGEGGRSPASYHTPWHEGRAVASFVIDRPGQYAILTFPTAEVAGGSGTTPRLLSELPTVALSRDGSPPLLGNLAGLGLLAVVPAIAGVVVLILARRRWPLPSRRTRRPRPRRRGRSREPALGLAAPLG